jgi:hypothetical protein
VKYLLFFSLFLSLFYQAFAMQVNIPLLIRTPSPDSPTVDALEKYVEGSRLIESEDPETKLAGFTILATLADQNYPEAALACGYSLLLNPNMLKNCPLDVQKQAERYLFKAHKYGDQEVKSQSELYLFDPQSPARWLHYPQQQTAAQSRFAHALAAGCGIVIPPYVRRPENNK